MPNKKEKATQAESGERFDETKSREEEWELAGKKVDEKANEE